MDEEGVEALYVHVHVHCTALSISINTYCKPVLPVMSLLPTIKFLVNFRNPAIQASIVSNETALHFRRRYNA